VVIPVRNDAQGLPQAVSSILSQRGPFDLEVFLCVGPSTDGTHRVADELATKHAQVHVLENPAGGIPQALNLGLAKASGKILARVDARCLLPDGYLERALQTLHETQAANVGARQVPVGRTSVERSIAAAMGHRFGSGGANYRHSDQVLQVDTAFLGVFDVARLRGIEGWDERFERNEDAEINVRLADVGGVWLDPELAVEYRPRPSLKGLARQYFDYGWWRMRTVAKHPGSLAPRQLAAPAILVGSAVGLAGGVAGARWLLALPTAYAGAVASVALSSREQLSVSERGVMAGALAAMHLSWGSGFLASGARVVLSRLGR